MQAREPVVQKIPCLWPLVSRRFNLLRPSEAYCYALRMGSAVSGKVGWAGGQLKKVLQKECQRHKKKRRQGGPGRPASGRQALGVRCL